MNLLQTNFDGQQYFFYASFRRVGRFRFSGVKRLGLGQTRFYSENTTCNEMEVWRLSSKRLAALTFFAHRSLERPLPKKTRIIEPIRKHRIVCGEKHQRESWVREKKRLSI